ALRKMIRPGTRRVGRDVDAHEEGLPRPELDVRVLQLSSPLPQRFDFRAGQDEPRLRPIFDEVVVEGLPVRGDRADPIAFGAFRLLHSFPGDGRSSSTELPRTRSQKSRASSESNWLPPFNKMISRAPSREIGAR